MCKTTYLHGLVAHKGLSHRWQPHQPLPADPACCWVVVQADIGSEDGAGADCFTMYVTTPKFLDSVFLMLGISWVARLGSCSRVRLGRC